MTTDARINELTNRLLRPESFEAVRGIVVSLDELSGEPNLRQQVARLIDHAFKCLRELSASDPARAFTVLTEDLLPRCLSPQDDDDGHQTWHFRTMLSEWLEDLPDDYRYQVREIAIPRTIMALDGPAVRNALRLIGSIGYWDDTVLERLARLIKSRDDDTGDHALSVRAWLKPEVEEAPWLLDELHRRIARGPSHVQLATARAIGIPKTAEVVWSHWVAPRLQSPAEVMHDLLFHSTLCFFAEIAARSPDRAVSEMVLGWLSDLVLAMPNPVQSILALDGLITILKVPGVVQMLVEAARNGRANHRCLYYHRLAECALPIHMAGWDAVPLQSFDMVLADGVKPTGMTGDFSTIELDQKEAAWDVLLCRGDGRLLPPFANALAGEASGHVLEQFLTFSGCLAMAKLPPEVPDLLSGAPSRSAWSERERLIAQIGAIRAAHGAANREAFDALFGYRQLGPGVLLSLVDALADVARAILSPSDRTPVVELLEAAESALRDDTRGAAAGAIAKLLEQGHLDREEAIRAAAVTSAPATDPYARQELLYAFAARNPQEVPPALVRYATDLLEQSSTGANIDPRSAAIAVLAQRPELQSDSEFLTRRLGLVVNEEEIAAGPQALHGVIPYLVGRYFVAEPERFGRAVSLILVDGGAGALSHVLPSVQAVGSRTHPEVVNALVVRLQRANSGRVAELPVIHALASVAPERLFTVARDGVDAWLPQARADLADTIARLPGLSGSLADSRFDLLFRLAADGIYAVRRAAYRAAAKCDLNRLIKLVVSWAKWREMAGHEGPRRRAAECAGWLPADVAYDSLRVLGWDQEPGVREAFGRSIAERDERMRAEEYEKRILSIRNSSEIIDSWRYGVALSQVGDDMTIQRLAGRMRDGVPPSVRFWLSRVRKAVERRWSKVTQKWPEPWFARPGNLESFTGTVRINSRDVTVSGTLWFVQAELPNGRSSWGGWATCQTQAEPADTRSALQSSTMNAGYGVGEGQIQIPGRRQANVIITSSQIPSGDLIFSGSGPYPDPVG